MDITEQLNNLFNLEKELSSLLDNEEYEAFQLQQDNLTDQIKALLDNNKPEVLTTVIDQLKELESAVGQLQTRSEVLFSTIKRKVFITATQ